MWPLNSTLYSCVSIDHYSAASLTCPVDPSNGRNTALSLTSRRGVAHGKSSLPSLCWADAPCQAQPSFRCHRVCYLGTARRRPACAQCATGYSTLSTAQKYGLHSTDTSTAPWTVRKCACSPALADKSSLLLLVLISVCICCDR